MNLFGLLFVGAFALVFVVAASYAGTMLALRHYHDGEAPGPTDFVGLDVDDGDGQRR